MKEDPRRTKRISFRCTPKERKTITNMAKYYKLYLADFIRQAILISVVAEPNPKDWQMAFTKANISWHGKPE